MSSARSLEELIVWQLADSLKRSIYQLISRGPITRDRELCDQLRRSAAAVPRLVAEGFGRYLPGDFSRLLRAANGELNELMDALQDTVDRGHCTTAQVVPLIQLAKRTSKAASHLIAYLRTADAPHEARGRRRAEGNRSGAPKPQTPEPPESEP